jgi:radical SAM protein with 4Fe4S-binding SPASM domain
MSDSPVDAYPYFPFAVHTSDEGARVRHPVTGKCYLLNPDACRLLELCDGQHTLATMAMRLAKQTGAKEPVVRQAAGRMLAQLSDMGLIWWRGERAGISPVPPPQQCYWDITLACNLRCAHCVVHAGQKAEGELSTAEAHRLLDELSMAGIAVLSFSGGEPLLRPDFFDLASYARTRGLSVAVSTNGTLIDEAAALNLARLGADVQVSLDGSTASRHDRFRGVPGAYDAALQGMAQLRRAGLPFTVGSVFSRLNRDDFGALLDLSIALGAKAFRLIPFIPAGRGGNRRELEPTPQELRAVTQYLRERRRNCPISITDMEFEFTFSPATCAGTELADRQHFGCDGGISSFHLTATGEVLPCSYFVGAQAWNVRDYPFWWIWQYSPFLNYVRGIRAADVQGGCRQCGWFAQCLGGCPAANLAHGKMLQPNVHCWVAAERTAGTSVTRAASEPCGDAR